MSETQPISRAVHAPRITRLLQLGLLFLALAQGGAAVRALTMPEEIAAEVSVPSALDLVMGTVWGALFAACVWGLRHSSRMRRHRALTLIGAYTGYALIRLIVFAQADYDQGRFLFLLIMVAFILLILLAAVYGERQ